MNRTSARPLATVVLLLGATLFAQARAGLGGGPLPQRFVGLSPLRSQRFVEPSQQGFTPDAHDRFGTALVAADFNGDAAADLVSGIPFDDCSAAAADCGAAFLSWGIPGTGLVNMGGFFWEAAPGSPTPAHAGDVYGRALGAGDFNDDGLADLVIGAPGNLFLDETGDVRIHYGLPGGIQGLPEHVLRPGVAGVPATGLHATNRNAKFGASFAVGDFDGDGHADLAIGAPDWSFATGELKAGSVVVAHGDIGGLMPFAGYAISQREAGIPDHAESGDQFGAALAAGDFNGDGFDDLAIGAPAEDGVGAVLVLFGSPNSLIFANNYWLGEFDLGGMPEEGDLFGSALTSGDFNGDGFADLAIGAWGDNGPSGLIDNMGQVVVLYGAPGSPAAGGGGLQTAVPQWWRENLVGGINEIHDAFGAALTSGDFNGDGFDDLAIGAPNDGLDEGTVYLVAGGSQFLGERAQRVRPGYAGYPGAPDGQLSAHAGASLAAADLDGDGFDDLIVGLPYLDLDGMLDAGGEVVLYGSLFSDGFESGAMGAWDGQQTGAGIVGEELAPTGR